MLANLPTDRPVTLLRYDGQNYNNFVIENQCGTPQSIEYHKKLNRLTVYCIENTFSCDLEGKMFAKSILTNHSQLIKR